MSDSFSAPGPEDLFGPFSHLVQAGVDHALLGIAALTQALTDGTDFASLNVVEQVLDTPVFSGIDSIDLSSLKMGGKPFLSDALRDSFNSGHAGEVLGEFTELAGHASHSMGAFLATALQTGQFGALEQLSGSVTELLELAVSRFSGDYDVDMYGFDEHFTRLVWLPLWRPLYTHWFRVEVRGAEHIPSDGALVVSNHAGVVPMDGLMTSVALHDEAGRHLRILAADLAMSMPMVGNIGRRIGATLACNADAISMLEEGCLVGVWPEGYKGLGKPYSDRYRLQRFGRGGFVTTALRVGAPIVPCSVVGSEEIFPKIGESPTLARLLGLPYFPITPFFPALGVLGCIPLPTKWVIEFGEPIPTDTYSPADVDDPMAVFELADHVRETIQRTLYRNLEQRQSIFFG